MNKKKSVIKKAVRKPIKKTIVKKNVIVKKFTLKPKQKLILKPKLTLKPKSKLKTKSKTKPALKIISKPKIIPKIIPKVQIISRPKEVIVDSKGVSDNQILESFLGSSNKVKLWKVFLLNTSKEFILKDLLKLTKIKHDTLILELRDLMKLGIVKAGKKDKTITYKTNNDFPLIVEITEMILSVVPRSVDKILEKLNRLNRLKIVLLSGFFTAQLGKQKTLSNTMNSNVDLLLVFEKVPDNVDIIISELEHGMGKELSYSALDQNDFKYRHSIGDKLIRDILDFDHVIAMDKLSFFR
jgi:hypothetical protein